MTHFDLHTAPGHLLRRLNQHHTTIFGQETAAFELTSPQFAVLAALEDMDGCNQVGLSQIVGIDRTTIGGVIDRLEARGWVTREPDTNDARRKLVRLTDSGRGAYEALVPCVERVQERLLAPLGPRERDIVIELLGRTVEELDE